MLKSNCLKKGDKVAIVSLSSGILGEPFIKHELDIAVKRLEEYGLVPVFMPNALKGIDYLKNHPEDRAEDLKKAFMDKSIKGIICAIGGDDTYKLIPYLMEDEEFINAVKNNPKLFTGFSDTTINHLMFYKLGLSTFYGPCLLCDLGELDTEMVPYTKKYFECYFGIKDDLVISSSPVWYSEREDFGVGEIGKPRKENLETHGFEVIKGNGKIKGKLLGGCLESLYDMVIKNRYEDENKIIKKYGIFPSLEEWKEKIMFIETCEEKSSPEFLKTMLLKFKNLGIFNVINGLIIGKPQDETYYEEYKKVYNEVFSDIDIKIMYNVNFGHSTPRCILPYGLETEVDLDNKLIIVREEIFK